MVLDLGCEYDATTEMYYIHNAGLYYASETNLYYDYNAFPYAAYHWLPVAHEWWPVILDEEAAQEDGMQQQKRLYGV